MGGEWRNPQYLSRTYGGIDESAEQAIVARTLDALNAAAPTQIRGWLSPGKSQSERTPELIAKAGLDYMCDWPNDDMPYEFRTDAGPLVAMPYSDDMDDQRIIGDYKHGELSFVEQVTDHCAWHTKEAAESGSARVLALNLHPWMIGQSHRIGYLEELLPILTDFCAPMSAAQICESWKGQQS